MDRRSEPQNSWEKEKKKKKQNKAGILVRILVSTLRRERKGKRIPGACINQFD